MHHGVDIVKHSDQNGQSLPLVSKALLKLPRLTPLSTDNSIKLMLLKDILTLFLFLQVKKSITLGAKDKSIYYTHEGARSVDALEQWAL